MLVNEISRLTQLTPAGMGKLSASLIENGVTFTAITEEISNTVKGMSEESFTASMYWYYQAHSFAVKLSEEYGVSVEIVAGIISSVSPRMPWLRNKGVAEAILREYRKSLFLSPAESAKHIGLALSTNVTMAIKIARGEDISNTLTGTKRRSFYNNIVSPGDGDSVTVDTWMVRSFMRTSSMSLKVATDFLRANRIALGGTGVGYYVIAEATRNVAKVMNVQPCQIQAAYWVAVSGNMDGSRADIS